MDSVTGLGGVELQVDAWSIDVAYSGTQKCLSAPPGISLITFSEAAAERVKSRNQPVQSWFLDLSLLMAYWDGDGGGGHTIIQLPSTPCMVCMNRSRCY